DWWYCPALLLTVMMEGRGAARQLPFHIRTMVKPGNPAKVTHVIRSDSVASDLLMSPGSSESMRKLHEPCGARLVADVAHALLRAVSRLISTPALHTPNPPGISRAEPLVIFCGTSESAARFPRTLRRGKVCWRHRCQ